LRANAPSLLRFLVRCLRFDLRVNLLRYTRQYGVMSTEY